MFCSVMGLGLFTQSFALVLLPLCLGWTWHALHGAHPRRPGGACLAAAGLLVLVWLSHAFYGLVAATAALVMVAARPTRLRATLPRLALMGGVTLASLLFWLLPLALTRGAMGGWPWGGADRWQGYGAQRDTSPAAMIRRQFYLLYEVQKYMPIRVWRRNDPGGALRYKQQSFALAGQI